MDNRPNAKVRRGERKGYCSDCGNWATDCETIIVLSIPEKVCRSCRELRLTSPR